MTNKKEIKELEDNKKEIEEIEGIEEIEENKKVVYIWNKWQALISIFWTIYLNQDGVIEVEKWSKEDSLCKSYWLLSLEELSEKYLEK